MNIFCLCLILLNLYLATADVIEALNELKTVDAKKPQEGNECLLKLMNPLKLLQTLTLTCIAGCFHISNVSPDLVWVSDNNNIILTNKKGVTLHHLTGTNTCSRLIITSHTVNSENELIYIDSKCNINKLSKDMKSTTQFVETTDYTWASRCVYWSLLTGDLLVGMHNFSIQTGKVIRFNRTRKITQTIQFDNTGLELYEFPLYITENNNGDIVVSDEMAVVVTDTGGRHRFSYIGSQSGSAFEPRGICTDALLHILVCDILTKTVHIINQDGQFLSYLLTQFDEMDEPLGLSYDANTHHLWVGTKNKKVFVYRYLDQKNSRKGKPD